MAEQPKEGGCLCGAVRYRVTGAPMAVEYCHCSMCRRAGGAPVVAWADVSAGNFAWLQGAPASFRSSREATRLFCGRCGSPLVFQWDATPEKLTVTVGTLDRPEDFVPRQHIYHADRLPWLRLSDDLPRYDQDAPEG